MKEYSTISKVFEVKSHHQMQFRVIPWTLVGWGSYSSAAVQSVYSIAPANWAGFILWSTKYIYIYIYIYGVCMYVWVHMSIDMYMSVSVWVYMCMFLCIYLLCSPSINMLQIIFLWKVNFLLNKDLIILRRTLSNQNGYY